MRNRYLILVMHFFCVSIFAQSDYQVSYENLKDYQGFYQYSNNTTLKIAASPKDTILYAIINQSRYRLKPFAKDIFVNGSNEKIVFDRDSSGLITGYTVSGQSYSIINRNLKFPKEMWYPRIISDSSPYLYKYTIPENDSDGLQTASLNNTKLDKGLLSQMVTKVVAGDYPNVHSILLVKGGKLVFEEYFYEYTEDSLHELRSASKSFISALTGIAINKGVIKSVNSRVLSYFPEYKITEGYELKKKITIENLLTNQSGLDCDISKEQSAGNETAMNNSDDWVKFTLSLPMSDVPGGKGMYCSGNPITLGRIIEKASGNNLHDFAYKNLFKPLGINHFKWNFKPEKANAEDFCQLYLTPRSMAKFGLLYLSNGKWDGKQIISNKWVKESFAKHSVIQNVNYGYLWWLKYIDAEGVRHEGYAAQGNGGQRIFLFPKEDLVVVITGGNYNSKSPSDELISKYILPAFNKK
jgi:CubicO group peptidase (beta-lactamase class C family)